MRLFWLLLLAIGIFVFSTTLSLGCPPGTIEGQADDGQGDVNPTQLVLLKNGTREPRGAVAVVYRHLQALYEQEPVAFNELVFACQEPGRGILLDEPRRVLRDLNLINDQQQIHGTTVNVVLSAVEGEGIFLMLVDPIAP